MARAAYEPIGILSVDPDEHDATLRSFCATLADGREFAFEAAGRHEALRARSLLARAFDGLVTLRETA